MKGDMQSLIHRAAEVLMRFGAHDVYLFGSAATGTLRDDSDIDMAVSGLPPENFLSAMGAISDILDRPLDLIDMDEDTLFTRYLSEKGKLQRVA